MLAPLLRWGHLPVFLLLCHLVSIFLFLLGSWSVAQRMFSTRRSCWGAVLLAACCFTLPVAGTSLTIMDPYVTARSFSTPLSLFALASVLDENWGQAVLWLGLTTLLHPLMAGYAAISMLTLALARRKMWRSLGLFLGLGWLVCTVVFMVTRHADTSLAYNQAALSRSYFFLSSWRWYEYPGLLTTADPAGNRRHLQPSTVASARLAIAATIVGCGALLTSLCFVHRSGSLLLARFQVLRAFQFVYLAGVLLAGGMLAKLPKRAAGLLCLLLLGVMFAGQRLTYPESSHVEWPGQTPRNRWQQAFLWIRGNTPSNAVFALDNDYIESPGEDAQGFRATAERSAVADWFKDGGIASNFPAAAVPWWQASHATAQLNRATDEQRVPGFGPSVSPGLCCPPRRHRLSMPVHQRARARVQAGFAHPTESENNSRGKRESIVHVDAVSETYLRLRSPSRAAACRRPARFFSLHQAAALDHQPQSTAATRCKPARRSPGTLPSSVSSAP